jgi:molecular chaperone IbpA
MSHNDIYNFHRLNPFTIGFNEVFDELEKHTKQLTKAAQSFPPYNIKQVSDNKYIIEMAVAGFAKTDIEVTLEGNKLVVEGKAHDEEPTETFLHKGIANRGFTHEFTLADKVEIENAELANGMLKIGLANMVKIQDAIKKIPLSYKG